MASCHSGSSHHAPSGSVSGSVKLLATELVRARALTASPSSSFLELVSLHQRRFLQLPSSGPFHLSLSAAICKIESITVSSRNVSPLLRMPGPAGRAGHAHFLTRTAIQGTLCTWSFPQTVADFASRITPQGLLEAHIFINEPSAPIDRDATVCTYLHPPL